MTEPPEPAHPEPSDLLAAMQVQLDGLSADIFFVHQRLNEQHKRHETMLSWHDDLEESLSALTHHLRTQPSPPEPPVPATSPSHTKTDHVAEQEPSAARKKGSQRQKKQPPRPTQEQLYAWVGEQIAPLVRKMTTSGEGGGLRWCRTWWCHHDAIERFTALYWAYGDLAESGEPGWLSTYLRDHLDPHLTVLTSPVGPFSGCSPTRHSPVMTPLGQDHEPPDGEPYAKTGETTR
ncbi:DUF4913 domain-containing protein [Sciscionella marina]|uniref:DUF4913 domain-containing protein n=1 Tax=Sciscionella marina TaxID=508770 RepID=UPI00039C888B|nr:DUF4913 domain-containing protein [Sciscionella marina]